MRRRDFLRSLFAIPVVATMPLPESATAFTHTPFTGTVRTRKALTSSEIEMALREAYADFLGREAMDSEILMWLEK